MPKNSQLTIQRSVDLRYSGQAYPLEINVEGPCSHQAATSHWEERFVNVYHELYGKVNDDNPIELASIRVHVSQLPPQLDIAGPASAKNAPPKGSRKIYVSDKDGMTSVPVFERLDLCVEQEIIGPAIIEERESTTVIGHNDRLLVNELGCLVVDLEISNNLAHDDD